MSPRIVRPAEGWLGDFQTVMPHGREQRVDGGRVHQDVIVRDEEILVPPQQFRTGGEILVGTWGQGLWRYSPGRRELYAYARLNWMNSAFALCPDRQGRLWIGTQGCGVQCVDRWDDCRLASLRTVGLGPLAGPGAVVNDVVQTPDGQIMEAESISAGLDYPGVGPMHANMAVKKRATVYSINDDEAVRAAYELTRTEGIIPALESAHAIAALGKMKFNRGDVVVLTVSGRGDKDVETYLANKAMAGEYGEF